MRIDDEVAALLRAGDVDGAVTRCIEVHGRAVHGYLAAMHDPDDADDVWSQWQLGLLSALPGFRFEASLRAWLFRLAWHASARFFRDPWRRRGQPLPDSAASRLAASIAAESRLPGGRKETLLALRRRLPPDDQTLYGLRVNQDLEWAEVAAVLAEAGTPADEAALRKRFERIKARLVKLAREEGLLE